MCFIPLHFLAICLKPLLKTAFLLHTPFKKPPPPHDRYLMTTPLRAKQLQKSISQIYFEIVRKHYKASFRHTVAQQNDMIGYLDSYANCVTVLATVSKKHPMHRQLTVSTLLPCWASVKTIRFRNPEYRLQKWNLLSLTSSSTEKENARHFYSIPYQLRANRRILLRADSMNYNLEKFAKGLKNIIVQLNVDCRTCDLCDSLNPPLIWITVRSYYEVLLNHITLLCCDLGSIKPESEEIELQLVHFEQAFYVKSL